MQSETLQCFPLDPELQRLLDERIAAGCHGGVGEVVNAALRLFLGCPPRRESAPGPAAGEHWSQQQLTAFFAQSTAGLAQCDLTGRFLWVNDRYCAIVGRPRGELLQLRMQEITHPEDVAANFLQFTDAIADGRSFETEKRYVHPDGSVVWVNNSVSPVRNSSGEPESMLAVCVDITAHKQAEIALSESEERHRILFEQAAVGVAHTDLNGRWLMLNQKLCDILGCSKDELIGESFQTFTHPDDLADDLPLLRALDAGEIPSLRREKRYIRKDGSIVWVEVMISVIRDRSGAPSYRVAIIQNVQDRKVAEEALRESQERLDLAVRAHRIGIFDWFIQTGRLIWTEQVERLYGLEPGSFEGDISGWASRVLPEDLEATSSRISEAIARGDERLEFAFRIRRPDGEIRHLEGSARFLYAADGTPERMVGTNVDVTERKRWEEHQLLLVNELNHRVKNTLATVQSIATQTLRNAATTTQAREDLEVRLLALSRAHDVLTRENWEGASLHEIVFDALTPYRSRGERRFRVGGPELRLRPRMALALALALHELATNATKYGALSNEAGEIGITWTMDAEASAPRLRLRWEERNGPPAGPPARRGFGMRLIERSLALDLGGEVRIEFAPTGVVCSVDAPLM